VQSHLPGPVADHSSADRQHKDTVMGVRVDLSEQFSEVVKACRVRDVATAVTTEASCFIGLCDERWQLNIAPSYLSSL